MIRALPIILVLAVWLYGVVDCARSDRGSVRGGLSKTSWFLVSLLPAVGTALWFIFARDPGPDTAAARADSAAAVNSGARADSAAGATTAPAVRPDSAPRAP